MTVIILTILQLKKLDENGNETGDNLIKNGGFESVTVNNTIKPTLSLAAFGQKNYRYNEKSSGCFNRRGIIFRR